MTMQTVMDRDTAEHFYVWMDRYVPEQDQNQVEEDILKLLADDPSLLDNRSWPELWRMTEAL